MRSPDGFVPFCDVVEAWMSRARAPLRTDETKGDDVTSAEQSASIRSNAAGELIWKASNFDLFVFDGSSVQRVSKKVLSAVSINYLDEDFDIFGMQFDQIDIEEISELRAAHCWDGEILFHLEPYTWTIDNSGFDFLSRFLRARFDPFMDAQIEHREEISLNDEEDDDATSEAVDEYRSKQMAMWEMAIDERKEEHSAAESHDPRVSFLADEYGFPLTFLDRECPFEALHGASLCIRETDWKKLMDDAANNRGSTIADETAAIKAGRVFLNSRPNETVTREALREFCGQNLGTRAFNRVFDELKKDFSNLGRTGRPQKYTRKHYTKEI